MLCFMIFHTLCTKIITISLNHKLKTGLIMKKQVYFALFVVLFAGCNILQKNQEQKPSPVLLTIDDREITKDEFIRIYNKNNSYSDASVEIDEKSVDEYLEMFINFKLKVIEAENLGLDTVTDFQKELATYRKQLAEPYFIDETLIDSLVKEAYQRKTQEINASHILIKLDKDALPEDTVEAYNKAMKIRKRIVNGEDFSQVAREVSDDPSAKKNDGQLGWFSAFRMVYPFESAAYNTKTGEVSMPVRTRFGYHLIKVNDRRPSRGEIKVAHIYIAVPPNSPQEKVTAAAEKVEKLKKDMAKGVDFAELVEKYSDDKSTVQNDGELPWFSSGRMLPVFEDTAFALKNNNDISQPFKSPYGWHVVKRIDKKDIEPFEKQKEELRKKIERAPRSRLRETTVIEQLKESNNYTELNSLDDFRESLDSTIFRGQWDADKMINPDKKLFSYADTIIYQRDFANHLETKTFSRKKPRDIVLRILYEKYVNSVIKHYETMRLGQKHPEFYYLMKEYHDGILLFNLTDSLVWSKAVKDTTGLKEFYEKNIDNYMWGKRVDAYVYTLKHDSVLNLVKKLAVDRYEKDLTNKDILDSVNTEKNKVLSIESKKFVEGENKHVDASKKERGLLTPLEDGDNTILIYINKRLEPQHKSLDEARGLVTADYQNQLEQQWIQKLRDKYKIEVNQEVLEEIKTELE